MASPTLLVLLRHASTPATGRRLGGRTPGVHLSERGIAEAEAAARRLAGLDVAAIHASPLERTRETARIVARSHGLSVTTDRGLLEVDFGTWTDRPLAELRRLALWRTVQSTPSRVRFPGGETLREVQARAVDACERLVAAHPGRAVIAVSHADVIKAVVAHHLGMGLDLFQRLVVDPASSSVLAFLGEGPPALLRINDVADPARPVAADPSGRT